MKSQILKFQDYNSRNRLESPRKTSSIKIIKTNSLDYNIINNDKNKTYNKPVVNKIKVIKVDTRNINNNVNKRNSQEKVKSNEKYNLITNKAVKTRNIKLGIGEFNTATSLEIPSMKPSKITNKDNKIMKTSENTNLESTNKIQNTEEEIKVTKDEKESKEIKENNRSRLLLKKPIKEYVEIKKKIKVEIKKTTPGFFSMNENIKKINTRQSISKLDKREQSSKKAAEKVYYNTEKYLLVEKLIKKNNDMLLEKPDYAKIIANKKNLIIEQRKEKINEAFNSCSSNELSKYHEMNEKIINKLDEMKNKEKHMKVTYVGNLHKLRDPLADL